MNDRRRISKVMRGVGIALMCVLLGAIVLFVVFAQLAERGWQDSLGSWKARGAICDYVEARYPGRTYDCAFPTSSIKYEGRFAAQVEFPEEGATIVVTYWKEDGSLNEQGMGDYPMTQAKYAQELSYPVMGVQQPEQEGLCPVMGAVDEGTRMEMLDSLQEDILYAYPMMWDADGDGVYDRLSTWPQWQSAEAQYWEVGLLTKEEFLDVVQEYEHWRKIAAEKAS